MAECCGTIHTDSMPPDTTGCLLPPGHSGPHEFIAAGGTRYQWETDLECDCDHCMKCEGDYCAVYWPVLTDVGDRGGFSDG